MGEKGFRDTSGAGTGETKADRLAAALRENLKKRKDLTRQRASGSDDPKADGGQNREDAGPNGER